ncbi:MAG TPA: histidine--tRNA ligase [Anaerolineae bacterium]|nr:histidine--tRNA ligase [Anaerolineae bacterium]
MKQIIRPVKGTRDFYPEQMAFRIWLYGKIKEVSQRFGYQEWEGPILERLELYAAKSGEELVKEQAFVFNDRGGDEIALRPELTPSLARLIAQKQRELPRPIRWWSFGPMWRYERPQKGRTREFFQWNIDLLGVESPQADAELAAIGAAFFSAAGLSSGDVKIQVNNRRLMETQVKALGVPAERVKDVYRAIDKLDKLDETKWRAYAAESTGLSPAQVEDLRALLDNRELWRQSADLIAFFEAVADLGASDYVEFEPSIIRGLDYYTGTVFEARDRSGEFRAILGGGRYDNLVADVGGTEPMPATGFALGSAVIELVLAKYGKIPALRSSPTRVLVTVFQPDLFGASTRIASALRAAGVNTELYPQAAKLDRQLKYADTFGIPFVVIVGPDEAQAGKATLKNLATGEQRQLDQADVVEAVKD